MAINILTELIGIGTLSGEPTFVVTNTGNVGIGTTEPGSKFALVDGTEANGYILTSDSFGNSTWQADNSSLQSVTDVGNSTSHSLIITEPGEGIRWTESPNNYGTLYLDNSGVNFSESDEHFSFQFNRTKTTRSNTYYLPDTTGILPLTVNGVQPDSLGNISLSSSTNPLDSATIYALTPTPGTQYYCSNCTGNGITGRIVAYIGAAWRRLTFE